MPDLRTALLRLPFVSEKADGTLNLWDVTPTGNRARDIEQGRMFTAWMLHLMREYDAAHMLFHFCEAVRRAEARPGHEDVLAGTAFELGDILQHCNCGHPLLRLTVGYTFSGDLREAALRLPFVVERADGSLDFGAGSRAGVYENVQSRGRFHGSLFCKMLRDTGHPSIVAVMVASRDPERVSGPYEIGFMTAIAEIAMSCSEAATVHQRAVRELYVASKRASRAAA
jgi:hypothetical protein